MRILIADDEATSRVLLRRTLRRWGHDVVEFRDGGSAARCLLSDNPPQLAILDWMMPELNGVEVCAQVRKARRESYVYVVMLTSRTDKEDLITALDAGADDFLTKPFDPVELRARLGHARRWLDLLEELHSAREALRIQATHDPLTGILNRAETFRILQRELARAVRHRAPLSVLLVDLDRFKAVNDNHGHLVGDAALREATLRMTAAVRVYDAIGRYGGEEFLVVLPGCDRRSALAVAERHRRAIEREPLRVPDGRLPLTVSIGAATAEDAAQASASALFRAADAAMYRAKKLGRNRVVHASELEDAGAASVDAAR